MTDHESPKTVSDAIAQHQEWMRYGEYLVGELTRSQRSEAEVYRRIREAFNRPELQDTAIVDPTSQTVYFVGGEGLVCSRRLEYAGNVKLESSVLHSGDDVVQLGEAS